MNNKKFLDHHTNNKMMGVKGENLRIISRMGKMKLHSKSHKPSRARPLLYDHPLGDRKFSLPKPILSNGVIP